MIPEPIVVLMMVVTVSKKPNYELLTCFAIVSVSGKDALLFVLIST